MQKVSSMKNVFIILGGLFLVVIIVVGVGITYLSKTGDALDKDSKAYAEAAIPAIITDWDESALQTRESPELVAASSAAELSELFNTFRKLGKLKYFDGVKGEALIATSPQSGSVITARYIASAQFDHGFADIDLGLIKHGEAWQILRFRLNSRALQQ
jgi:hypothetical protein